MDIPKNLFKRALAERRRQVGSWLMSASTNVAEAMACVGFDYLVVDMEHAPLDVPDALEVLRAIAGTPTQALVRLAWSDMVLVKRMLDAGAQSLMFPYVQTVEEAKRAVTYTRYPTAGVRGVAAMHRAARYGTATDYLGRAAEEIAVVLQIESPSALALIPQMAAIDGVDGLFIGPADLSANMGLLGRMGEASVVAELRRGVDLCHAAGKPVGIVSGTVDGARAYAAMGFDFVAVGVDLGMLVSAASQSLAAMRGAVGSAPAAY
jgi:2-keto-3-deoxy-L-rhamnonate aldolase RhmA